MKGFDDLSLDARKKLADEFLHRYTQGNTTEEDRIDCAVLRQMEGGKSEAEAREHLDTYVPTLRDRIRARRDALDSEG
jgi:hypothetical protein